MPPRKRLIEAMVKPLEGGELATLTKWIELGAPEAPDAASNYEIVETTATGARVRIRVEAPGAERVEVLGDFTVWEPVAMSPQRGGWDLHIGTELEVRDGMRVRLGYAWEDSRGPAAAVTPFAPASGTDAVSGGIGLAWEGLAIDAGYRITFYDDAEGVAFPFNTAAADGVYESIEHRLAIGVSRAF